MCKKVIGTAVAIAMMIILCNSSINNIKAAPEDGDICTNPWEELFTTEVTDPGDLDIPGQTTTVKPVNPTTTEKKEDNTGKVSKPGKGKVVSATRKSKKVKKAKITVKKINGAKGYQIQISTNKRFKKILVKKTIKKQKVIITSKRIKNRKKLYVRVRAYKINGKEKVWGKWSLKKIIKIKKK